LFTGIKAGVNYGLNKVRFVAPVHVGANLRAKVTLKEVKDIKGGVQVRHFFCRFYQVLLVHQRLSLQVISEVVFEVEAGDKTKTAAVAETVALYYF
jgi:acyl dehydratase